MSFQLQKSFVRLQNTIEDILGKSREACDCVNHWWQMEYPGDAFILFWTSTVIFTWQSNGQSQASRLFLNYSFNLSQNNTQAVHSDIKHSSEKSYSMFEKYNLLWREPRIQIWAGTAVLISPNFRCIFPSGRIASQCVWFRLKSSGYVLHAQYRFPPTEVGVCACGRRVKELLSLLM